MDSGLVTSSQLALFCHSMAVAGEEVWGLNAYNHLVPPDVLSEKAKESDERRRNEEPLSIFDGIPLSIKSNIAEKSLPLTAGSAILGHGSTRSPPPPCGYDADTVQILLREKGGICIGLTNMDEFGMGSLGTNVPKEIDGGPPRFVKNPLPFLRYLRLDDRDNERSITVGKGGTRSTGSFDDERLATIVRLPPETIAEKHREALDLFRTHESSDESFYSPGGSSSGSAVSVAHGSSLLSLGTDTGGSIRLPAAWCGLVGLKPSYGLLSRHGVVSYASSFDTVGILANSVDCAASALDVLAQRNTDVSRDSTFSSYDNNDNETAAADSFSELEIAKSMLDGEGDGQFLSGIKVGIPASFSVKECPNEIRESWGMAAELLHRHGAEIVQVSTDTISPELVQTALSAYYVLVSAEASSNLSRYDGFRYGVAASKKESHQETGNNDDDDMTPLEKQFSATRGQGFGAEVTRRILCGTSVLSSDRFHTHYEAAAKLRAALAEEMSSVLETDADVLLIPTVLSLPPKLDNPSQEEECNGGGVNTNANANNTAIFANDVMTVPASLAGLPAVAIPVPIDGEETFLGSMQLISSRLNESILLKTARVLTPTAL